jgi:HD-GYP domain-containing protein (c-di-GMP phosphodiesterase class II)
VTAAVARDRADGERSEEAVRFALRTAAWFAPLAEILVTHCLDAAVLQPALQAVVLAAVTGAALGLSREALEDVALAALLADIGMVHVPPEIRAKPGPFLPLERRIMQRHVELGVQMLAPLRAVAPGVIETVANHHERADGTGYPSGQVARTIPIGAQVVAVVQRFQAAVSPRPWRVALPPHEALDLLMTMADRLAPLAVVEAFVTRTLIYPLGAAVRLSDGSSGVVAGPGGPGRPVVERRAGADGARLERTHVDLTREPTLFVDALGPTVERPRT